MKIDQKPPHLPAQSCRVDTHYHLRSLKWALFFIFLAFVSGFSASIIATSWILPSFFATDNFYTVSSPKIENNFNNPDVFFQKDNIQKVLKVYDASKKTGNSFYDGESWIFNAAILSSDGWCVAYYPKYSVGLEKKWEIVDYQGNYHEIKKVLMDDLSELIYIKVEGDGFKINSFLDWKEISRGVNYWAVDNRGWQEVVLSYLVLADKSSLYHVWQPYYFYSIAQDLNPASVVLDSNGSMVGIVDKDNLLIPSWLVKNQINNLLNNGKIGYYGPDWQGYMVNGVEVDDKWKKLSGFYIIKTGDIGLNGIKNGDVVLKISGEDVSSDFLAEQIYSAPDIFTATVWRDGQELEIEITKQKVY